MIYFLIDNIWVIILIGMILKVKRKFFNEDENKILVLYNENFRRNAYPMYFLIVVTLCFLVGSIYGLINQWPDAQLIIKHKHITLKELFNRNYIRQLRDSLNERDEYLNSYYALMDVNYHINFIIKNLVFTLTWITHMPNRPYILRDSIKEDGKEILWSHVKKVIYGETKKRVFGSNVQIIYIRYGNMTLKDTIDLEIKTRDMDILINIFNNHKNISIINTAN